MNRRRDMGFGGIVLVQSGLAASSKENGCRFKLALPRVPALCTTSARKVRDEGQWCQSRHVASLFTPPILLLNLGI